MPARPLITPVIAALGLAAVVPACDVFTEGLDVPIAFATTFDFAVDLGEATGAAMGQRSPVDAEYPLTIGVVDVDLVSGNAQLAANRDKIEAVEITEVTATPMTNTLTAATPPIDIYVGPAGATSPSQAVLVATLPAIPAGSRAAGVATIDAAGQAEAQALLLSFDFVIIPVATLSVSAGETVPGGEADLRVALGIKAIIDPLGR